MYIFVKTLMELGLLRKLLYKSYVMVFDLACVFRYRDVSQLERFIKRNYLDAKLKRDLHRDGQGKSSAK